MTDRNDADGSSQTCKVKKKSNNSNSLFKGDTTNMCGHMFQLPHESENFQQFSKTIDQVKAYVSERFLNPTDTLPKFKEPHELPQVLEPPKPENPTDMFKQKGWSLLFEDYLNCKKQLEGNMAHVFSLIWGQCSISMKEKLKGLEGFSDDQEGQAHG